MDQVKIGFFIFVKFTGHYELDSLITNALFSHSLQKQVKSLVLPDEAKEEDEPVCRAQFQPNNSFCP